MLKAPKAIRKSKYLVMTYYKQSISSHIIIYQSVCVCCIVFPFILDARLVDVPAGITQEDGHTEFLIHLPSAVLAFIFLARRIQSFLSLVDREVEFCVLITY